MNLPDWIPVFGTSGEEDNCEDEERRPRPYSTLASEISSIRTDDIDTLRAAREEARDSLDKTIEAVEEKDSKAISTVRLNLLLIGLAITAISSAPSAIYFANWFSILGFFSLLASTFTGMWAYTYTNYTPGITADYLNELDSAEYLEVEWLQWMNQRYQQWIQTATENEQTIARYLGWTHVLQIIAVGLLVIGVIIGLLGMGPAGIIPNELPSDYTGNETTSGGNTGAISLNQSNQGTYSTTSSSDLRTLQSGLRPRTDLYFLDTNKGI